MATSAGISIQQLEPREGSLHPSWGSTGNVFYEPYAEDRRDERMGEAAKEYSVLILECRFASIKKSY